VENLPPHLPPVLPLRSGGVFVLIEPLRAGEISFLLLKLSEQSSDPLEESCPASPGSLHGPVWEVRLPPSTFAPVRTLRNTVVDLGVPFRVLDPGFYKHNFLLLKN